MTLSNFSQWLVGCLFTYYYCLLLLLVEMVSTFTFVLVDEMDAVKKRARSTSGDSIISLVNEYRIIWIMLIMLLFNTWHSKVLWHDVFLLTLFYFSEIVLPYTPSHHLFRASVLVNLLIETRFCDWCWISSWHLLFNLNTMTFSFEFRDDWNTIMKILQ